MLSKLFKKFILRNTLHTQKIDDAGWKPEKEQLAPKGWKREAAKFQKKD